MYLSSEAGPQRLQGGVAQPQNSMKESLTDITLRQTIDRTARSCRASNESRGRLSCSWSCARCSALLCCGAQLEELGRTWRAARSDPQLDGYTHTCHAGVPSKELAPAGDVEGPPRDSEHTTILRSVPRTGCA